MITSSLVGAGAGAAFVLVELVFGEELESVESAAVGCAVMGIALTAYNALRDDAHGGIVDAYWAMAAIAGVPAVVAHWSRRKVGKTTQLATQAGRLAERDYRRAAPPPTDDLR